jgi:hypothetical protein
VAVEVNDNGAWGAGGVGGGGAGGTRWSVDQLLLEQ